MGREWLPLAGALTVAVAASAIAMLNLPLPGLVTACVASLLILVTPGYAIGAALIPLGSVDAATRVLVSIGLSLAISALGALILNLTPAGLTPDLWTMLLAGVTIAGTLLAVRRGRASVQDDALPNERLSFSQSVLFLTAGILIAGALVVAVDSEITKPQPSFTELWMLALSDGSSVTVGIGNHESSLQTYLLQIRIGQEVLYSSQVDVLPGANFETDVPIPPRPGDSLIVGEIFLGDEVNRPYREVTMWAPL